MKRGTRNMMVQALRSPYVWAVLVRGIFFALSSRVPTGDAYDFNAMAYNVANGIGLSRCTEEPYPLTAVRPPLYPLLLGWLYRLGLPFSFGPAALNLSFDLGSIWLLKRWASGMRFKSAAALPWIIVFCPFLITYFTLPLTENVSVFLLLAATLLLFQGRPWSSGLVFGALSLCRSYFLLFPFLLVLLPSVARVARLGRKTMLATAAASLLLPAAWVARNYFSLGIPTFSQTGTSAYQAYSGLCIYRFDWYDHPTVDEFRRVPGVNDIIGSQCKTESELAEINRRIAGELKKCILERPLEVVRNKAVNHALMFLHWGQILPYKRVEQPWSGLIDASVLYFWSCIGCLLWAARKKRSKSPSWGPAWSYALSALAYTVLITLPFAVDPRYLLGPLILVTAACFERAGSARKFFSLPLELVQTKLRL